MEKDPVNADLTPNRRTYEFMDKFRARRAQSAAQRKDPAFTDQTVPRIKRKPKVLSSAITLAAVLLGALKHLDCAG